MFTGIIECTGIIEEVFTEGTNRRFRIKSPISSELKVDQSIAHNGVCLTVEWVENEIHQVTAIDETLKKTNLGRWKAGDRVNLERCLKFNGRIDGHFVQGHVDTVAECMEVIDKNGSWVYRFALKNDYANLFIEKGSISINGISLTLFDIGQYEFSVAIIPYTYSHTNMQFLKPGDYVNIEFDMIGKYINRIRETEKTGKI